MEDDRRYQWLEKRVLASLNPKREAIGNLIGNEDNKLVILEFLNNEDVKQIYIYSKSVSQLIASKNCLTENLYDKGIYFLKISNTSKLSAEKMNDQVVYFEASFRIFDHMDLMTREVFMPLLCADTNNFEQSDKLMDIMHRIITQIAVAQSQIEDSVTLPLPALGVLASAANNPSRRLTVLHILETTLINWQKQIKNVLKQQPEIVTTMPTFFTKDEIHVWTTCINKLNNLIVQFDAPHVKDILMNLQNNNSVYLQSFSEIRNDIRMSINGAEINLKYISTLTSWIHRIKSPNLLENAQYLFNGLFHTVLLIWQHSKYYHSKQRFAHMLLFLSNEIVAVSHEKVGNNVLQDPLHSYDKLKEALRICAMFRGTYLDFKEKADALNSTYHKLEKKIDFNEKLIWWVESNSDRTTDAYYDEFEVMRQTSPWPKRNHQCFLHLNVFMERCNDALELVQTMRHFQIFAKTVSIGGADNKNMDLLAQEIHAKYAKAIDEFQQNVSDVMNFDDQSQNFEISFFKLRTTIKELERELSQILNLSIRNCTTINSKLRLLEVFEGVHERDVIQSQLQNECNWLITELLKEFDNVKLLANNSQNVTSILPTVVTKLFWLNGLEQRIKVPMEKFSYLYPNLLQGDLGYKLREIYKQTCDHLEKIKKETLKKWESKIASNLTEKLQETVLKNVTDDPISKRPIAIEVNLSFELEKLLKEIHYLKANPLKIDLTNILQNKFNNLKNENLLRLYATRIHSICDKYNLIMKNIQPEELALFEIKLARIDHVVEVGLNEYTWNSVEIPDYIEKAHSVICTDVFQNLELTQSNIKEIQTLANKWCNTVSDVFNSRDHQILYTAKMLEEKQSEYHSNIKKIIVKDGSKIHSLIQSTLKAVEISEASPGWQDYINYTNEIIFNSFKVSSLSSLEHMFFAMTDIRELENPFVCIDLELVDGKLHFNPPLDEQSHIKNLQEILFDFINTFISRGSYMQVIGKNRNSYDQIVARDEAVYQIVNKINVSIEETIIDCKKTLEYFNAYNYLWTSDIHATFEEFLKGKASLSINDQVRPPSKNETVPNKIVTKSIASLGSALSPEVISNIERAFLSPYYQQLSKFDKENSNLPLLSDFDSEIAVYVNAREQVKNLQSFQSVNWIKVNLQPTIDVLITLTNKLIWKFTSFLSNQIKKTLSELEIFLKRMEPEIEHVTGEERDTNTFMKIMRVFNEVSSKQQEMEVKFELIKRTLKLLKKYERFDVSELEASFNTTPIRWKNLKSKVTLAKQRLGPTIQEESKIIIQDLKKFSVIINNLKQDLLSSFLFERDFQHEKAFSLIEEFVKRFENLQNEAADLKQLQELLDSDIVDFGILIQSKTTLNYLKKTWKTIEDIRNKHNEWKSIRWQKVNIKSANEETDKQLEYLENLPKETSTWDVILGVRFEINNIKMCLPICEEISNQAMRTRHWKQLVRVSGGTALVDNETLKMLTFGQLLDLNLHAHGDEVKLIVQKAVKDLSIEQTLRTYEEIWLSKVFKLEVYESQKVECLNTSQTNDEPKLTLKKTSMILKIGRPMDTKSSGAGERKDQQSRRSSHNSKPGNISSRQNAKRLSIGSLPNSLMGIEASGDNPVHIVAETHCLFAELEHHQNVLGDLMHNQSAGSFYDEIIKWSNTLQNIEAVMRVWDVVQIKWKRLEPIYTTYDFQVILPNDTNTYFKTDKDFKNLMKATVKNNNILKCCQRKNILSILKHMDQNLDKCYTAILQILESKRQRCPRFYLLSDEDLIEVLCCGSNLENLSQNIGLVFSQLKSLNVDSSTNDKKIVGCFGKSGEYFPLEMPIIFRGSIEELINSIQISIPDSIRYLLELSLSGKPPPFQTFLDFNEEKPEVKPLGAHIQQENRPLPAISESFEAYPPSLFAWTFQHTNQVVELTLRILLTKQVESSLSSVEEMKNVEKKLKYLINFYQNELCVLKHKFSDTNTSNQGTGPSPGLIINSQQKEKLDMIIKLLVYYKNILCELIQKQCTANSSEWLSKVRYYVEQSDNELNVLVKTKNSEIFYGFQYQCFNVNDDVFSLFYQSEQVEKSVSYMIDLVHSKSSPLVHGQHSFEFIKSISQLLGYENNFFLCSQSTTETVLSNTCNAMVTSGCWVTFVNMHNLPSKLMSCLSSIINQIKSRNETITINNVPVSLFNMDEKSKQICAYFSTTQQLDEHLTNSNIDSLKITKIDHWFLRISKDLFDKFLVFFFEFDDFENIITSNLTVYGFTCVEALTSDILKLIELYNLILKTTLLRNDLKQDMLNPTIIKLFIKQANDLMFNQDFNKNVHRDDLSLFEKSAIGVSFSNSLFPRLDVKSKIMLMSHLKTMWKNVRLPLRHQLSISNHKTFQNLPIKIEKETAIQIEDNIVFNNVNDAVVVSTSKFKLASSVFFQSKCANLIENLTAHKNLILVGQSGFGKTTLLNVAIASLAELGFQTNYQQIYINGYSDEELFGKINDKTGMMAEGLISNTLKSFNKNANYNIFSIIGESSPDSCLLYDSLFSQEPIFLNQNNEKVNLGDMSLNIIWETDDLSNLTPTILSSSNLFFLTTPLTIWQHYIDSAFLSFKNVRPAYNKLKNDLISILAQVKAEFDLKPFRYTDVLPVMFESKVKLALAILKSIIGRKWDENDTLAMAEYCVCSGMSASMTEKSKEVFNSWIKTILKTYPKDGTIYDYFYDIDGDQFVLWSDNIPTFSCPIHQGIPLNVFVHTPSTMFLNSMIDVMMNLDESFMIAGETGCGKTSLITDKLKTSCSGDLTELFYITINTNRLTNNSYLYNRINHHLSWLHGLSYIPKGNKKMYCFIDDIHQAQIDSLNRQSAIEFLRQHLDSGKFYDFTTKKSQIVKNVTYISTYNYKSYSPSKSISNKNLKHFHIVAQHFPINSESHGIYTKLLYRHFIGDIENESQNAKQNVTILNRLKNLQDVLKSIVQSSIDLNQKMRSIYLEKHQRLHYIFSLRIVTSLFRHMCISLSPDCTKEQILLQWHHECNWLYGARMIDCVDVERYELAFKTVSKMNFNDPDQLVTLKKQVHFSNLKETESGIVIAGQNSTNNNSSLTFNTDGYMSTTDLDQIRKLITTALNEYNKEQQRITLPLYESTLNLICRLCHTMQSVGGNCCIVADGGVSPFVLQLVASLMQYTLVNFKTSQFVYNKDIYLQQLKHKLLQSLYKAGIKGEKVMLCLTEEEMDYKEFLVYITEFTISEEVMHLFTIEEETTILNSIRTQVVQAGLVYSKETAWEFFIKNIRENTRVVVFMNDNADRFQALGVEYPSLFQNMELLWIQHWNMRELVSNATYHLTDIDWLDESQEENVAHLLASMHNSIKENDDTKSAHLNNLTYTKFIEKFKEFLLKKYSEIEVSHKNVCRLLEHIQRQHSTAKKLLVQLQQENMVLEERIQSTDKMLQQIGQDMTMTEQQLKVHNMQTKKTVQLKRILPEYQSAHERNVYKTVAIVANTKKLIQNINMKSLQELRSVSKPSGRVEDILASVIIILKSPTADVTWQKGAKRQMANLDRFLDELQTFDEHEITENTIKLLADLDKKIIATESSPEELNSPYYQALNSLHQWTKGVLKYHSLMIHHVRPLHKKCEEIEKEVKEADHKLTSLDRKSEALNSRLRDLAENFEEATVDKEEQHEKVVKMKQQLQTASELNIILSREFDRNMQVYESVRERIFCLPASCALAAGFLIYLGPYQFPFRRIMLTNNWIKCLHDRGLPLVLDHLNLIKGRVVKWQMDSLAHLLSNSNIINIPGEDWKVHFASDQIDNQLFMGQASHSDLFLDKPNSISDSKQFDTSVNQEKVIKINEPVKAPEIIEEQAVASDTKVKKSPSMEEERREENLQDGSELLDETAENNNNEMSLNKNGNETIFYEESMLKIDGQNFSTMSRLSEQTDASEYFVNASSYRNFLSSLLQFIVSEEEVNEWMSTDTTSLELENAAIIKLSEKHPPLIYDPFKTGNKWIQNQITELKINLELRNPEDLIAIEKSFQSGTKILYTNCNEVDSSLLPLIYYKNSMDQTNSEDSRLVLFSSRRLFCNPIFQMYFTTSKPLSAFTPNTLAYTTPISYAPSIENFVDQFQLVLFKSMFPEEYKKRNLLMLTIKDCTQKIKDIDFMLKNKWEKLFEFSDEVDEFDLMMSAILNPQKYASQDGFNVDHILNTKLALQRKYYIGEVLDYCQEYLANLNDLMKILTPVAVRASLLMTLLIKIKSVIKNYDFSVSFVENILLGMNDMVQIDTQELQMKSKLPMSRPQSSGVDLKQVEIIEAELPEVPSTKDISSNEIQLYSTENIEILTKHLTNTFINKIMISLLPEHRLYLLALICFYIKLQEKNEFSDLELEFLMRKKHSNNINILLSDFNISKASKVPQWLSKDSLDDLMAMSLLQGDLDHFIIGFISNEKDWQKWYTDPVNEQMPKIEMETEKSRLEWMDLNDFKKLIITKVLRPDLYMAALNDYVNKALMIELDQPEWNVIINNPAYRSIIINQGTQSSISSCSSTSRIHKNFYKINELNDNALIVDFDCTLQTISEIQSSVKNVKDGFLLFKNVHLASPDIIGYIKQLCELVNSSEENMWKIIITKAFDFVLPETIMYNSLQVSFDVFDIMARNLVNNDKKFNLTTCQIKEETLIFNFVQSALNMTKNNEIAELIGNLPAHKKSLIYIICFAHGILQVRQCLTCGGFQRYIPWSSAVIVQSIQEILRNPSLESTDLASILVKNVFKNYIQDKFDLNYIYHMLNLLTVNNEVQIGTTKIPIPGENVVPANYSNWIEEQIPEREFPLCIIQLNEKHLMYYNTIRAENFIDNLEKLWETNNNRSIKLDEEIQQDWLHFAIQMCHDRLPSKLPNISDKHIEFCPENSVTFALYQEYNLYNNNISLVKAHLENIEKFILFKIDIFPAEWKSIALTLQSQRVPSAWETACCRPSTHTLKSWIKAQYNRFIQLKEIAEKGFKNIHLLDASILREPTKLLSSLTIQRSMELKLNLKECELFFEVREDEDFNSSMNLMSEVKSKGGLVLKNLKVVGAQWDWTKKTLIKSENLFNKLPSLFVYADRVKNDRQPQNSVQAYMTHLRQSYLTNITIQNSFNGSQEFIPYIVFDQGDEDSQSRRLQYPIQASVNLTTSNLKTITPSIETTDRSTTTSKSGKLATAGQNIKQNLLKANQTLNQIKEVSTERFPGIESQLSFKPMSPNAPPLPPNLQALVRSEQL